MFDEFFFLEVDDDVWSGIRLGLLSYMAVQNQEESLKVGKKWPREHRENQKQKKKD